MGEYGSSSGTSGPAPRRTASSASTRSGREARRVTHAPVWIVVVSALAILSSLLARLVLGGQLAGYLTSYALSVTGAVTAIIATVEDQRRMREPAYSLNKAFRPMCAGSYVAGTVLTVVYIVLVAFHAATS